ncbi:MAG: Ig-like domain-containing protein, partial [Pseudomonadota bacterium]
NGSFSVSFGAHLELLGDPAVFAEGGDYTRELAGGATHVFDVATSALVTTLANDPPTAQERFGSFVSLSADRALISAWRARDEDGLDQVGAAYIFEDLGDQPPLPVDVEAIDSGSYRLDVDGSVDHSPDNENFYSGGRNTGFIVFSLEDLSDPIESGSIDFFKDIRSFASGVEEAYVQSVSFRAFDGDVSLLRAGGNQPDVAAALTTGAEIARADIAYEPDVRDRGGYDVAYPARIASFDAELLADGVAFLNDAIKAGVDEVAIGIVLDALGPGGEIFSQTSRAQGNVVLSLGFSEDAPEAADDAAATSEDAPAIIDVLANDAAAGDGSPARDPLSIVTVDGQEIVPGEPVALASGALVTLQPDGRLVYDPNGAFEALGAGAEVLDVFGYEVFDGFASDAAEVSVAVGGANDAPVVQSSVLTIDENSAAGAVVGTPSATDPEDDPLIFAIVGGDVDVDGDGSSSFAIDAATGLITVNDEDDLDFETRQRFELIVRVGDGDLSAEGTVTVEVGDLPDAPGATVLGDDVETGEDGEASGDVATADPPDADATLDAWSSGETEARPDRQSPPLTDDSSSVDPTLEVDGVDHVEGDGDRADAPPSELGSDDPDDAATITAPVESGDDEDAPQRIFGSDASETLRGGNADDRIYGRGERDELRGGRGDDRLYGQEDDDRLLGEAGDDQLHGGVDDDVLSGGAGDDSLFGQFGADRLWGGDGDDMLDGGRGADVMSGGPGDDVYYVDHADDVVDDRGDPDDFDIVMVMQTIRYQLGASVEHAMLDDAGGGGEIVGNRSDNVLSGNAEENALRGRGGHDTLDGARGDDVANGGAGRDLLIGGGGADRLLGRRGGDELVGNQGRDRLDGGRGGDALSGGAGRDVFVQSSGVDLVKDWRDGKDVFEIARGATRFGDLEFERRGDDVLIKTGSGDFRVESVEVGEFDRTDFFFV